MLGNLDDIAFDAVSVVEPRWVGVSAVLFLLGVLFSYPVAVRGIELLTWYPLWIWKKVRESLSPHDPWHRLFVFLFVFNSVSLLVNVLSGFTVVGPPVFALLLGLNLGVISVEETGAVGIPLIFLNPVAWLELPAAFVSLAIGTQIAVSIAQGGFSAGIGVFPTLFDAYLFVVLPLLFAAALLEASMISFLGRMNRDTGKEAEYDDLSR